MRARGRGMTWWARTAQKSGSRLLPNAAVPVWLSSALRTSAMLEKKFVFVLFCRIIRRPHLHQTRRTGAGESLAPRLLAARYYYRTRSGDTPEKTASRNCAASS